MTTREYLEERQVFERLYVHDTDEWGVPGILIAHLDKVGWPETPKVCETCRHLQWHEHQDVCGRCH